MKGYALFGTLLCIAVALPAQTGPLFLQPGTQPATLEPVQNTGKCPCEMWVCCDDSIGSCYPAISFHLPLPPRAGEKITVLTKTLDGQTRPVDYVCRQACCRQCCLDRLKAECGQPK